MPAVFLAIAAARYALTEAITFNFLQNPGANCLDSLPTDQCQQKLGTIKVMAVQPSCCRFLHLFGFFNTRQRSELLDQTNH